jgi:hypothetical protein
MERELSRSGGVTELQGYKVTRLQGYKVTRLQGYKVTRLQGFRVSGFQSPVVEPVWLAWTISNGDSDFVSQAGEAETSRIPEFKGSKFS